MTQGIFLAGILFGLFEPEDGNYKFLRTLVGFQRNTWRYIPEVNILQDIGCLEF
jgi:hypothetical protein